MAVAATRRATIPSLPVVLFRWEVAPDRIRGLGHTRAAVWVRAAVLSFTDAFAIWGARIVALGSGTGLGVVRGGRSAAPHHR